VNVEETTLNIVDVPFTIDNYPEIPDSYIQCKACGKIQTLNYFARDVSTGDVIYICKKCKQLVFILGNKIYTSMEFKRGIISETR